MESGNNAQQEHLRPRDPDERELHRLVSEASVATRLSDVVTPVEPSAEVVHRLTRATGVVPREPSDDELRQLHASSGGAVGSKGQSIRGGEALRPREPAEGEVQALLQRL
jgi:hypothetical protein